MHGYQHLCLTNEPGLGSSLKSEFAGLPFEKQKERLEKSFEIFNRHQIIPQIFVAPWNTLDENTLRALIDLDLKVVSNGLYLTPCIKSGIIWIPQQLVRFRPMPFGIYTICFHPSSFREDELKKFEEDCYRFHSNIISLKEVLDQSYIRIRDINLINKIFPKMWRSIINFRESIKK